MKNDIIQRIVAVLNALNATSVTGKQNLMNMSGSISILEEVVTLLQGCDITTEEMNKATCDK